MPSRKGKARRRRRPPKAHKTDEGAAFPAADSATQHSPSHLNLPPDASTTGLRQSAFVQLQRRYGNKRALQLIPSLTSSGKPSSIQRDTPEEPFLGIGTPLIGLKPGDGLNFGTYDKRERVTLLQFKLNEKMIANIKEDGMFGPRTEEVLNEFQESMDLPISSVVDPVTADLLMAEAEPEPAVGPEGEIPHPGFVSSGASLNGASTNILSGGLLLSAGGAALSSSDPFSGTRSATASILATAEGSLGNASAEMASAGIRLAEGHEAAIRAAGEHLVTASTHMQAASAQISIAGNALSGGISLQHPLDGAAGEQLTTFGEKLGESAFEVERAGFKLQEHEDFREQIGDPIVGLKKGDGLIFGTFNRRDRVRILQNKLNNKVGAGLKVDGMFGPLTTEALQAHQATEELPQTERVDSATAKTLRDASTTEDQEKPLATAGGALVRAGETLSLGSIFLNTSGSILMSGAGIDNTADVSAGQVIIQAGDQFQNAGNSLRSAGSDLQSI